MDDTRQVFGIDLGTTYSCVAQVDNFDQAVVLQNFDNKNTTPSVVYFGDIDNVIVGEEAKELSKLEPDRTVSFVKRSISEDTAYDKTANLFPQGLDPTEISAYILKKIVADANNAAQNPVPVTKVVITCPAYFGTKERMRTKQAGEIAGLEVLDIINEPTAAAIAYGMKVQESKVIMVYDLGGGTFDVTIIRVNGGTVTVVATGGDHHLGGVDWDITMAQYLLAKYNQEKGTSFSMDKNPNIRNAMMLLAEEQKKRLTGKPSVNVVISPRDWGGDGESCRIELVREVFDQLTEAKLDETIAKTHEVIAAAKAKGFAKIDEVLLVGGSSRMPQIKDRVDKEFNCDAKLTDPDGCVAKGAAIYALNESYSKAMEEYAEGERDDKPDPINTKTKTRVLNVTSKNYGTDYYDSDTNKTMVKNMIFANTLLDGNCRAEEYFQTMVDNQERINFSIYESDVADEDREEDVSERLETHTLTLTKQYPKGTSLKFVMEVDGEGILSVHTEIKNDVYECKLQLRGLKSADEIARSAQMVAKARIS